MRRLLPILIPLLLIAGPAFSAGPDGNVEWAGLSHVDWLDRAPRCPADGDSFTVSVQSWANDLTDVRVRVDDGAVTWVEATLTGQRGPYDIWLAELPATAASALSYVFELSDDPDIDYLGPDGPADALPAMGFAIDFATLAHAPLGATLLPAGGVVFKVWSPGTASAHVRGAFNGWGLGNPMSRVGEHWIARVPGTSAGQSYKYFFDSSHWNTDPCARRLDPTNNLNALIVDPDHAWQVGDFQVPAFEEMVIYQLHTGTFAGRNDPHGGAPFPAGFADLAARAEHLAELGVNAVMLNPVQEFPGDLSAGYNPITQWASEWIYGDPAAFKAMVDALHAQGIAVLLDIVWNHFSPSDNFLWWYDGSQIYFDDPAVDTPWGSQADFDRAAVRDYFVDSALYWLEDCRVDGFRMDATDFMNIGAQEAAGWSLMQRLNDLMDRRCADKIALAEQLPDDAWVTRPTDLGGAGFDSQYHDAFTDRLREEIFAAAFGSPSMGTVASVLDGSGSYLAGTQVTNYLELHDEAWPSSGGQRLVKHIDTTPPHDDLYAKGRVKLGQGLVFTAPGIPAILMGSEWLEDTGFGTDAANRIDWSKKQTYAGIFDYFRTLIALRRQRPGLHADADISVTHLNEADDVIAFTRGAGADALVIVAHFGNADRPDYRIGLPAEGPWRELLNSQDPAFEGDGPLNGDFASESVPYDGQPQSTLLDLPAMGLLILAANDETGVEALPAARVPGLTAHPNPFNPRVSLTATLPRAGRARLEIHDIAGRRIATLHDGPLSAGAQRIDWAGRGDDGRTLASGIYLARLTAAGQTQTRKLVLLR